MSRVEELDKRVVVLETNQTNILDQVTNHLPSAIKEVRNQQLWMFATVSIPMLGGIAVLIWRAVG